MQCDYNSCDEVRELYEAAKPALAHLMRLHDKLLPNNADKEAVRAMLRLDLAIIKADQRAAQ